MEYNTNVTYFFLDGYVELDKFRYIYFVIVLIVYIFIMFGNGVVIFVIYTNQSLHEPMYIFIAALLLNSLVGPTALHPKLLDHFLSEHQVVSYQACILQAFFVYTYLTSEATLLSAMAYDRYVSVCKPLQYTMLMKPFVVKKLLLFCWLFPVCENGVGVILTFHLKLCNFRMRRIYCDNYSIVKLSCGDISINNMYGFFVLIMTGIPTISFIIFSYVRILAVCFRNSKDFREKALRTCFPHLLSFIIFFVTACFEVISSRFETKIPLIISMILSVENMIIPPLINPIIYGLKLKEVSKAIKRMFWKEKIHVEF